MIPFLVRRLLEAVPSLVSVTIVVFLFMQAVPGDIALSLLGPEASLRDVETLRRELRLDLPAPAQYVAWLRRVLVGDLGTSIEFGVPVAKLILSRLGNTMILTGAALGFAVIVGLIVGIVSATTPNSAFDRFGMLLVLLGNSMPAFWVGMLLILFFSLRLGWFPVSGMYSLRGGGGPADLLAHLVLPAITLGSPSMAVVARITRSSLIEVLQQDYIRTARSKGLHETNVLLRHGLRNALLPTVTVVGLQMGTMLGGAVLTETVFSWPGVGLLLFRAITSRDLPLIQGGIMVIAVGFVLINVVVDLLYAVLDPRIEYQS